MGHEKPKAYLVYESWVTAGRQLDRELWHDLRDRIDDYALFGRENYEGLKPENVDFLHTIFAQIDQNVARRNNQIGFGIKSPGAPAKSDYAYEREMLEFGLSGAEIARYYGVVASAITQSKIYNQWKADGKPTPLKIKGKGRPTAQEFCEWKGVPYEPTIVNNQKLIIDDDDDDISYVDSNGNWNF